MGATAMSYARANYSRHLASRGGTSEYHQGKELPDHGQFFHEYRSGVGAMPHSPLRSLGEREMFSVPSLAVTPGTPTRDAALYVNFRKGFQPDGLDGTFGFGPTSQARA